ncbi:unnamed protein product [Bursaphelenchus okinawaensis]|uniref:GLOBIN domain-containing protein n=1 Tax=Bursaphelenchus okinawaensis TaxID=465554 RepID=A0A811LRK7_9BILA|nr:unnamed protein product [Bursaphelenchus okinawaensis]CAG9127179.1 unnamed protein product [Bursaphelenchus okinawaensis]
MGLCCSTWADYNTVIKKQNKEADDKISNDISKYDPDRLNLTQAHIDAMKTCWTEVIAKERRDIFHKTMLFCIEASPKLNEIIAMNRYCYRDLTRWPKLNEMCTKKYEFFEKLIVHTDLSEDKVQKAVDCSGRLHATYSKYGMKPHFLDIFQQQFLGILFRLKEHESYDKDLMLQGFTILMSFMIERMNVTYAEAIQQMRNTKDEKSDSKEAL